MDFIRDLTEEDEKRIPLPDGWIQTIKFSGSGRNGEAIKLYKNINTGLESEEHPFILQALNAARKNTLPVGWMVEKIVLPNGSPDSCYFNPELNIRMFDPPSLRFCLGECLLANGIDPFDIGILPNAVDDLAKPKTSQPKERLQHSKQYSEERKSFDHARDYNYFESRPYFEIEPQSQQQDDVEVDRAKGHNSNSNINSSGYYYRQPPLPQGVELNMEEIHGAGDEDDESNNEINYDNYIESTDKSVRSHHSHHSNHSNNTPNTATRDWNHVYDKYVNKGSEYTDKITHRVKRTKPPVTPSGIRVLKSDVIEANERVHQLIIKLRTVLSNKSGIECSFLYHDHNKLHQNEENDDENDSTAFAAKISNRNNVTLASDIVTSLRQNPKFIIMAMATTNKPGSPAMLQIAFTVLHRILHPLSSDSSMTTALLLQGINYQLDEMMMVEQMFSNKDSKHIISRALLIYEPTQAIEWDPLNQTIPTVPQVPTETVLSCLLRVYSIRRDVTSYFRTIWRPVLPGILSLFHTTSDVTGSHIFANMMALVNRLLECTFSERSMIVFPSIASAICRALQEIGGNQTMHAYILHFLIIPNVIKILAGDHESLENEDIYRVDSIQEFINKYYDSTMWTNFTHDTSNAATSPNNNTSMSFDPLPSFVWCLWRLYSHAVYLEEMQITVLSTKDFVNVPLNLDISAVPDPKLKNMVTRLRRKMGRGCDCMLQMPLDTQASEYMGIDMNDITYQHHLQAIESNPETGKLLDQRMSSLLFKPNEMLNLTVVSKYELGSLLTDIGVTMELTEQHEGSNLYVAIAEYLNSNVAIDDNDGKSEELMELVFLYSSNNNSKPNASNLNGIGLLEDEDINEYSSQDDIKSRYHQLLRGLKLCNRYEDALIKMIFRAENNIECQLAELVYDDNQWYFSPEFDTNYKVDNVTIATKHTAGSSMKLKKSHHGVPEPKDIKVFPNSSKHPEHDPHPNKKSMSSLQKEFFESYRFGSSAKSVGVGTSMARKLVLPPKLKPGVTSSAPYDQATASEQQANSNYRSKYTKIEVPHNAAILAKTESVKNQQNKPRETPHDKDGHFMKSMRGYEVIPTEEFQNNYKKRQQQRQKQKFRTTSPTHYEVNYGANNKGQGHVVQAFPEHLRHRIRNDYQQQQQQQQDHQYYNNTNNGNFDDYYGSPGNNSSNSRPRSRSNSTDYNRASSAFDTSLRPNEYDTYYEEKDDNNVYKFSQNRRKFRGNNANNNNNNTNDDDIAQLIRDYNNVFRNNDNVNPNNNTGYTNSRNRSRSNSPTYNRSTNNNISQHLHRKQSNYNEDSEIINYNSGDDYSKSGPRSVNSQGQIKRSRTPTLPEPISGGKLFAPTQNTLNRMLEEKVPTNNYLNDGGRTQELRTYKASATSTQLNHPPFRQSSSRIYPSTGPRAPRAPEFLGGTGTGARSRSNSRNSSPVRSRNNSFNNLNAYFKQQQQQQGTDSNNNIQDSSNDNLQSNVDEYGFSEDNNNSNVYENESYGAGAGNQQNFESDPQQSEIDAKPQRKPSVIKVIQQQQQQLPKHHLFTPQAKTQQQGNDFSEIDNNSNINNNLGASFGSTFAAKPAPRASIPIVIRADSKRASLSVVNEEVPIESDAAQQQKLAEKVSTIESNNVGVETAAVVNDSRFSEIKKRMSVAEAMYNQNQTDNKAIGNSNNSLPRRMSMPAPTKQDFVVSNNVKNNKPAPGSSSSSVASNDKQQPQQQNKVTDNTNFKVDTSPLRSLMSSYSIKFNDQDQFVTYNSKLEREKAEEAILDHWKKSREEADKYDPATVVDEGDELKAIKARSEASKQKSAKFSADIDDENNNNNRGNPAASPTRKEVPIPLIKRKSHIRDRQELIDFFTSGFTATKHGRSGAPKPKTIILKEDENGNKRIEWSNSGKRSSTTLSSLFGSSNNKDKITHIDIGAIVEVRRGIQTEVLMKAGLVDPACCFSIVTPERTLDLTMSSSQDRDMAIRGLQVILENNVTPVRFI